MAEKNITIERRGNHHLVLSIETKDFGRRRVYLNNYEEENQIEVYVPDESMSPAEWLLILGAAMNRITMFIEDGEFRV